MASGDEAGTEASSRRVVALEAALAERDAEIDALTKQNEALAKQVEALTELLGRNSQNSHLPPSSDGPGSGAREDRAARNKRKAERRKRGAQTGHRGSHRELLPAEQVDTFVNLFPEVCLGCARSLPESIDAAACRYQQLDLRDHRPHLTEWLRHEKSATSTTLKATKRVTETATPQPDLLSRSDSAYFLPCLGDRRQRLPQLGELADVCWSQALVVVRRLQQLDKPSVFLRERQLESIRSCDQLCEFFGCGELRARGQALERRGHYGSTPSNCCSLLIVRKLH